MTLKNTLQVIRSICQPTNHVQMREETNLVNETLQEKNKENDIEDFEGLPIMSQKKHGEPKVDDFKGFPTIKVSW